MAIGYSSKFGTITSMSQLLGPKFKNAVALNGNPTAANAALNGVMMANLVEGGSPSDISKGVNFFHQLKAAGNFSPISATGATIKAGTTPVVFNLDYLNLPSYVGVSNWKVFVPPETASSAGTTPRPSTRTRRTLPPPGCGRRNRTRRLPLWRAEPVAGRVAPGRSSSRR